MADPATESPVAGDEEFYSSWSLLLVCLLLIISLSTSYYLQIRRIRAIHETLVSIFAGMFVGFVVRLAPGHLIREMLTFQHTLFFNLLLPPIILNSGYEMKQENFFRNFGSIIIFAFAGTFIAAVGLGVLVFIYSFLGLEDIRVTLLECLIFGSTLSATDPVTILAIFNQYKVDPKLYSIIFGESLLNDAVSIVMYETLSRFHGTEIYISSLFHGIGLFLFSFSISMALGIVLALALSLTLKHTSLAHYPHLESALVPLVAYTAYFLSNGLGLSGIVSLLFCGITLKHYAYHTMSRRTQRATKYLFSILAQLSENFIFIYLGLSLFTSPPSGSKVTSYIKPLFILITTLSVIFTRYASVFPLAELINLFHRHVRSQRTDELPHAYQMMLFWAGLRGAVGVALAAGFQGESAEILRTTVLVVVVATVLIFGGTTARMLEILKIRTGVVEEGDAGSSEDEEELPLGAGGAWLPRSEDERRARLGIHYGPQSYNHHAQQSMSNGYGLGFQNSASLNNNNRIFSTSSSSSYDSDIGEVLPLASPNPHLERNLSSFSQDTTSQPSSPISPSLPGPTPGPSTQTSTARRILQSTPVLSALNSVEDGKWFQTLDERYLLPLFSNATASRSFHARRARRAQTHVASGANLNLNAAGGPSSSRNTNMNISSPTPLAPAQFSLRRSESPAESDAGADPDRDADLGANANEHVTHTRFSALTESASASRLERGLRSPMQRSFSGKG